MHKIAGAFLCMVVCATAASQNLNGVISVRVLDPHGKPVPGALVSMDPPPDMYAFYVSPTCETDLSGVCSQARLAVGDYYITAMKPSDGYPDLSLQLYSQDRKPTVATLTEDHPSANVVFAFGPRAAKLKLTMIDDASGVSVDDPTITLRDASDPGDFVSIGTAPDSSVLIPADVDVELEVIADKFEPWRLIDHPELRVGKALHLHSEENQELVVRLRHR